jgi:hypothetical protein
VPGPAGVVTHHRFCSNHWVQLDAGGWGRPCLTGTAPARTFHRCPSIGEPPPSPSCRQPIPAHCTVLLTDWLLLLRFTSIARIFSAVATQYPASQSAKTLPSFSTCHILDSSSRPRLHPTAVYTYLSSLRIPFSTMIQPSQIDLAHSRSFKPWQYGVVNAVLSSPAAAG